MNVLRDGELTAFSQDEDVDPSTYKTLDKPGYWGVHGIGKVWAEILWVVSQGLIEKHGFSDTLFPPSRSRTGPSPWRLLPHGQEGCAGAQARELAYGPVYCEHKAGSMLQTGT